MPIIFPNLEDNEGEMLEISFYLDCLNIASKITLFPPISNHKEPHKYKKS